MRMSRAAPARSKETSKKRALTGRTLLRNIPKSQPLVTFSGGSTEISRLALCTRRFGKRAVFNSLFSDRARRAHEFPSHLAQVHEDRLVINSRCGAPSLTGSVHSAFYSRQ